MVYSNSKTKTKHWQMPSPERNLFLEHFGAYTCIVELYVFTVYLYICVYIPKQ